MDLVDDNVICPTNTHLSPEPEICKVKIDEKYKFVKKGFFYNILYFFCYTLTFLIFFPITWLCYGVRVKGRKNLRKVKNAVFISNHVLPFDTFATTTHAILFKHPYFISNHRPFKMPVIRHCVRYLRAVPLAPTPSTTRNFLRDVDGALKNGKSILIYPEGAMWDYYPKIRPFMPGAFRFSIKNNVPIVPIVITFRKACWLYRILGRKKPFATINILEPITISKDIPQKQKEQELELLCYNTMTEYFNANNQISYFSKPVQTILKPQNETEKE
ncbi:MAG: 1-acyl-sn-glycerol-3-phosphate acyltransferase [Clostridia bacterium]|nr:1-acyl-sn-glycerol-3-phosphate acyltransferase [Clostridia bacterium]